MLVMRGRVRLPRLADVDLGGQAADLSEGMAPGVLQSVTSDCQRWRM
jgi:hypothetical protein